MAVLPDEMDEEEEEEQEELRKPGNNKIPPPNSLAAAAAATAAAAGGASLPPSAATAGAGGGGGVQGQGEEGLSGDVLRETLFPGRFNKLMGYYTLRQQLLQLLNPGRVMPTPLVPPLISNKRLFNLGSWVDDGSLAEVSYLIVPMGVLSEEVMVGLRRGVGGRGGQGPMEGVQQQMVNGTGGVGGVGGDEEMDGGEEGGVKEEKQWTEEELEEMHGEAEKLIDWSFMNKIAVGLQPAVGLLASSLMKPSSSSSAAAADGQPPAAVAAAAGQLPAVAAAAAVADDEAALVHQLSEVTAGCSVIAVPSSDEGHEALDIPPEALPSAADLEAAALEGREGAGGTDWTRLMSHPLGSMKLALAVRAARGEGTQGAAAAGSLGASAAAAAGAPAAAWGAAGGLGGSNRPRLQGMPALVPSEDGPAAATAPAGAKLITIEQGTSAAPTAAAAAGADSGSVGGSGATSFTIPANAQPGDVKILPRPPAPPPDPADIPVLATLNPGPAVMKGKPAQGLVIAAKALEPNAAVRAAAEELLVGRILISAHMAKMFRCLGISNLTIKDNIPGFGTHEEYFEKKYGITGLSPELPLLVVALGRGLRDSCLKPPGCTRKEREAMKQYSVRGGGAACYSSGQGAAAAATAMVAAAAGGWGATAVAGLALAGVGASATANIAAAAAAGGGGRASRGGMLPGLGHRRGLGRGVGLRRRGSPAGSNAAAVAACFGGGKAATAKHTCPADGVTGQPSSSTSKKPRLTATGNGHNQQQQQEDDDEEEEEVVVYKPAGSAAAATAGGVANGAGGSSNGTTAAGATANATAAAAAGGSKSFDVMYLPMELAWVIPVDIISWRHLQVVPSMIYRVDSLLALQGMQKHLGKLEDKYRQKKEQLEQQQQEQLQQQQVGGGGGGGMDIDGGMEGAEGAANGGGGGGRVVAVTGGPRSAGLAGRSGGFLPAALDTLLQKNKTPSATTAAGAAGSGVANGAAGAAAAAATANGAEEEEKAKGDGGEEGDTAAAAKAAAGAGGAEGGTGSKKRSGSSSGNGIELRDILEYPQKSGVCLAPGYLPPTPPGCLLLCGMTSSGCREGFSLERMEYLGDVVLKCMATMYLLHTAVRRGRGGAKEGTAKAKKEEREGEEGTGRKDDMRRCGWGLRD